MVTIGTSLVVDTSYDPTFCHSFKSTCLSFVVMWWLWSTLPIAAHFTQVQTYTHTKTLDQYYSVHTLVRKRWKTRAHAALMHACMHNQYTHTTRNRVVSDVPESGSLPAQSIVWFVSVRVRFSFTSSHHECVSRNVRALWLPLASATRSCVDLTQAWLKRHIMGSQYRSCKRAGSRIMPGHIGGSYKLFFHKEGSATSHASIKKLVYWNQLSCSYTKADWGVREAIH